MYGNIINNNNARSKNPDILHFGKVFIMPSSSSSVVPAKGKAIILFSASWCGHCKTMMPEWEKFMETMRTDHSQIKILNVDADELAESQSAFSVSGYPTIYAFENGKRVAEFDSAREADNLKEFAVSTFSLGDTTANKTIVGGSKPTMRRKRQARQRARATPRRRPTRRRATMRMRGGGSVDVQARVPAHQQWTNPNTTAPPPAYNAGLYTGAPFAGPWGNIPVTPTTANYINNNLQSAEPPPLATTQYPGTERLGNNFSAMPGVDWFQYGNNGAYNVQCVAGASPHRSVTGQVGGSRPHQESYFQKLAKSAAKIQSGGG